MTDKNRKLIGFAGWVAIAITLLSVFAGIVTSINRAVATEVKTGQIEKRVEIISDKISDHETRLSVTQSQLGEIQKSQDKMDKKLDRLLERVK